MCALDGSRYAARVPGDNLADLWQIAQTHLKHWPRASFLASLDASTLRAFLAAGELKRFSTGDDIVREGDPGGDLFLLLDAIVKVTGRMDGGGGALLAIRLGGDIIGEIALVDGKPRIATVSACGIAPVTAARIGHHEFHRLLKDHPAAAIPLASAIGRKLRSATRRRIDSTCCPPKVRLARALLELAEDYGHQGYSGTLIGVNLTRIELGTLVGVGKTTAERALRELKQDGLVEEAGRRLLVPGLAALRAAASVAE
jgi:CRP/FNR family transcriptional regulator, cyclic AMP receptor protein